MMPSVNPSATTEQSTSPRDLAALLPRRQVMRLLGGAGLSALLAACASDDASSGSTASTSASASGSTRATTGGSTATTGAGTTPATTAATTATTAGALSDVDCATAIPEETAGPFPGDGSNGPNVLTEGDVVRQDIRSSFGSAAGTAEGVPLTIELDLVEAGGACGPLANAAVYLWHCDRDGNYSIYSDAVTDQNYLRGVQVAGADGKVRFTTIFPGCYSGRWPHAHFEVFASEADATGGASPIATSQLAFPQDVCDEVYATTGYETSERNLSSLSLSTDGVFRDDGAAHQLGRVSGSVGSGLTIRLVVPV